MEGGRHAPLTCAVPGKQDVHLLPLTYPHSQADPALSLPTPIPSNSTPQPPPLPKDYKSETPPPLPTPPLRSSSWRLLANGPTWAACLAT
jgi:hypothetical protein